MAIIAYAAGVASPQSNPSTDKIVDLAVTALGSVPNQALYGAATDSADASPVFTYAWTIIASPTGSTAALVNAALQNVEIQNINIWGNVRLFLVATNTNTSLTSESDPLLAPSSAFVVIRLKSAAQGIQKMAAGERNWHDDLHIWADVLDTVSGSHTIISHSDVVSAKGTDLDVLSNGSYAVDPDAANPTNAEGHSLLHKQNK